MVINKKAKLTREVVFLLLPHEIVSKYLAPNFRGLIAHNLVERGLGQFKIAKLMGLSQPMINKLLNKPTEYYYGQLESLGLSKDDVKRIVELAAFNLYKGKRFEYLTQISSYFNLILKEGRVCNLHRSVSPEVPPDCDLCQKLFQVVSDPIVEEIKASFQILISEKDAFKIIPEVGSNIVASPYNSISTEDIAGFSGKIVKVGEKIIALGDPVKGGSKHTANVLSIVKKKFPHINSAFVIKFSEECLNTMKKIGYNVITVGPHKDLSMQMRDLESALESTSMQPDAIADLGGLGIEPVIYVLSFSATEAVKKAFVCLQGK